jgi:hypothetical protein
VAELADFALVGVFGFLVAVSELCVRYTDAPLRALRTRPAAGYMLVNVLATIAALAAMKAFDLRFGTTTDNVRWARVVIAGFGAIAFFRSSFFLGRHDSKRGGPVRVLQALLDASDRAIARQRAFQKATGVPAIVAGLTFAEARDALPTYCFGLMAVSDDEQREVGEQIRGLEDTDMPDTTKVEALGLVLINVVGEDVVRRAVQNVKDARDNPATPGG